MEWKEFIIEQRKKKRLSIKDLATEMDEDPYYFYLLENGITAVRMIDIQKYCQVFQIDFYNFLKMNPAFENDLDYVNTFSETSILERIKTIPDEKLSSHGLNIKIKALKDIKSLSIEDFIYLCDDGALDKYRLYYGKAFPLAKKEKDKKILSVLIMIVIIVCLLLYIEYQLNIFGIFKAYY